MTLDTTEHATILGIAHDFTEDISDYTESCHSRGSCHVRV